MQQSQEQQLRRRAHRQGLQLVKSRCRTPEVAEHGTYMLIDPYWNVIVALRLQSGFGMTLEDVEDELATRA